MSTENYIVSARKYRPATFQTVVGQQTLTTTLKNAIANNKLAHAYLFCGPRGVGKTTCARIFAKTINCLNITPQGEACNECESCKSFNENRSYNIHELDAASNNSVDDIRQLMDQVRIPPQIGKYKVFIIDEVHMLSNSAFNAALKTLEEPPPHAIFILATTEKHKIIPTILSRCQIYDFNRISVQDIVEQLHYVASEEGVEAEADALTIIAQKADGGMRDALSIFDQVVSFANGSITYSDVIENLNVLDYEYYFRLTDACLANNVSEVLLILNDILNKGFDGSHFITGLSSHFRDLLVSQDEVTLPLLEVGASIRERYKEQAQKCQTVFLYWAMRRCNECDLNYKQSKNKRLLVEIALIQLAQLTSESPEENRVKPLQSITPNNVDLTANRSQTTSQQAHPQAATVSQSNNASDHSIASRLATGAQPQVEKKIPTLSMGSLGISITQSNRLEEVDQSKMYGVKGTPPVVYEDCVFTEKDLFHYWVEYTSTMTVDQKGVAASMLNAPLTLTDSTLEATFDNVFIVSKVAELVPQITAFLQDKLHNRTIRLSIRESEQCEIVRAYSPIDVYNLMIQKNAALQQLQQTFQLELD